MKRSESNSSKMVGVRLTPEQLRKIDEIAAKSEINTRSTIIRFLINRALSADLAGPLIDGARAKAV